MNKSNNHAFGLLKSQYISVLKKCAILNAMAAFLMLPAKAGAADSVATLLSTKMGTNVGGTLPSVSGLDTVNVYINGNELHITTNLDPNDQTATMAGSMYGDDEEVNSDTAWILNQGTVNIGNSSNRGTFSNIHSQTSDSDAIATSGGLVVNGSRNYAVGSADSLLTINNVVLSNISTSPDDTFAGTKNYGGVVETYSTNTANAITNSSLSENFVMGGAGAYGGAVMVYNGARKVDGSVDIPADSYVAVLSSSNNAYENNRAGNRIYNSSSKTASDVTDAKLVGEAYYQYNTYKYGETARGGAIYNGGDLTSNRDSFTGNYAIGQNAFGGAIYNTNKNSENGRANQKLILTAGDVENNFSGNTAYAESSNQSTNIVAAGGAVYNNGHFNIDPTTGTKTTSNSTYSNNEARTEANNANAKAYGGALANTGVYYGNSETFSGNQATSAAGQAFGGAIYNGQLDSTASIKASTELLNATVRQNVASAATAEGGAVFNDALGQFVASASTFNENRVEGAISNGKALGGAISNHGQITVSAGTFSNNSVIAQQAGGGAIAHTADSSVTVSGSTISIGSSNVTGSFTNNTVTAGALGAGGAVAVSGNGALITFTDSSFTGNTVGIDETTVASGTTAKAYGGAIYSGSALNSASSASSVAVVALNSNITVSNNRVYASTSGSVSSREYNGGAFYNDTNSNLTLQATGKQILISSNDASAGQGGGIYNKGTLAIITSGTGSVDFTGNTAQQGEAIYNSGTVNVTMNGTSSLNFNSNQNVYNTGTFNVTGNYTTSASPSNTLVAAAAYLTQSVNSSISSVNLNSELAGSGTYKFTNAQLNMQSNGLIDYEPTMNLTHNNINMSSGSRLNLDYTDSLSGNDIDVASGAVVNYRDSASIKEVTLANTLKNAGLVNVADSVISDIKVTNLSSNGGTINIDVDNPNLTADVIKVSGITVGTTNITFDEQHSLSLNENDRIYFAQTAAGLSLSDYGFTSDVDNGEYTILIGNEVNATDAMLRDWYFYRYVEPTPPPPPPAPDPIDPEDVAYVNLPRAAVEQTRSLLLQVGRTNHGGAHCECTYDECNNPYCRMTADGTKYRLWATPLYRWGKYKRPVETDYKIYGVDFGLDMQPNEKQLFGVFGSYRDGKYEHDGKGKIISANEGSEIDMKSMLAGLYYRHYFGNTYMLGAVYGGKLDADIKADNGVTASTDGTDIGAQLELGHDFQVTGRETLTPSIRATYDYIKFDNVKDSNNKEVKIEKAHDVELEAAIKYEYRFNNQYERLTTGYIKPSVIQTIENGGEVTINDKKHDNTLKNETLGRVEVGADAELSDNMSVGAFGNYTFGSNYSGWGIGGNLRVIW